VNSSPYHGSYCPIDGILAALPGKRLDGEIVDRCGLYYLCYGLYLCFRDLWAQGYRVERQGHGGYKSCAWYMEILIYRFT